MAFYPLQTCETGNINSVTLHSIIYPFLRNDSSQLLSGSVLGPGFNNYIIVINDDRVVKLCHFLYWQKLGLYGEMGGGHGHGVTYKGVTIHHPKRWHSITGKGMCAMMWYTTLILDLFFLSISQICVFCNCALN